MGEARLAIATGVAVTGACNDHHPLPTLSFPACQAERTFTVNATCALCVLNQLALCTATTCSIQLVCGALGHFSLPFFHPK